MIDRRVINKSGMVVDESAIKKFEAGLGGELIRPHDSAYDAVRRVWNGMIDKYPSLIAYCADDTDVRNAVNFAGTNNLLASVRSGGHNVAGHSVCDEGIVIDLSRMKRIEVDVNSRTVVAQAGLNLGELDKGTQSYGLATPVGIVSKTGLAGLTLGGGIGWLMRKYGLTCDNLLAADVVTADGRLLKADSVENPDLFWGIRGGGGNFGIATRFQYRLYPVGPVIGGMVLYPAAKAKEVFRFYRDYISSIPYELTTMLAFLTAPTPFLLKSIHGDPLIALHVCYTGSIETGEKILKPIRTFIPPLADMIKVMPYVDHQSILDGGSPPGLHNYWKSSYLSTLNDSVMEIIIEHFDKTPSPMTQIHIQHIEGAVSQTGEHETAFSHRKAFCVLNIVSKWIDPPESEKNIQWTRSLADSLKGFSSGAYVNFLGDEGEDSVNAAYSSSNYARLVTLKNKYDLTNFFCLNQNIKPIV